MVIDFGIAAAHEQTELTRTGMQLGTPGWMAPEQVRGRRAGPPTDVFAWGMVVAYAASGRPPFGRGPADALYYRVVHQRPHLPEGLPAPLDALVPAALVKDPRQRPSVADLVTGLETGEWPPRSAAAGNGSEGAAEAPTTGSVPTIVAAGWGPRPCRPEGLARRGRPCRRPRPPATPSPPRPGPAARVRARPPPGRPATAPTTPATEPRPASPVRARVRRAQPARPGSPGPRRRPPTPR